MKPSAPPLLFQVTLGVSWAIWICSLFGCALWNNAHPDPNPEWGFSGVDGNTNQHAALRYRPGDAGRD